MNYIKHSKNWRGCKKCPLCKARNRVVLGRGTLPAPILFIGEAPGESEDVIGQPFIGPAGKLLDRIIQEARVKDGSYAITNLVGCIPIEEGSKATEPPLESIEACRPRLVEFVQISKPRLIVLVGKLAKKHIYGEDMFGDKVKKIGGAKVHVCSWLKGRPLEFIDIIHPAAILRADISQRGLAIQRAIVALGDAVKGSGLGK